MAADRLTPRARCPRCSRGDLLRAGLALAAGAAAGGRAPAPALADAPMWSGGAAGTAAPAGEQPLPTPIPEVDRFGHHNVPPAPFAEPSEIFDFQGRVATAVLAGTGRDNQGNALRFDGPGTDVRFMAGDYVAADGRTYRGTFVHL